MNEGTCSIDGCENHAHSRTWCHKHYRRWWLYGDPLGSHTPRPYEERFEERLWSKVDVGHPLGCWVWTGLIDRDGYGTLGRHGRGSYRAHREAYRLLRGEYPQDQTDHLCRNRRCVNPDHLEDVTPYMNTHRGYGLAAKNALKESCHRGHAFTEVNTYRYGRARHCRTCKRDDMRRRRSQAKQLK